MPRFGAFALLVGLFLPATACIRSLPRLLDDDGGQPRDFGSTDADLHPADSSGSPWRFVAGPDNSSTFDLCRAGSELWGVTYTGRILRFDGQQWAVAAAPSSAVLNGIWCDGAGPHLAVGGDGTVIRRSGSSWGQVSTGVVADLNKAWGSSPSDIWIVGDGGTILHYDGSSVASATSPVSHDLRAIYGFSASQVWIAGDSGTLLQLVSGVWQATASPTTKNLKAIFGRAPDDVWAVGRSVIHYDGGGWAEVPVDIGVGYNLEAMRVSEDGTVWAVGELALMVKGEQGKWTTELPPPIPPTHRPNGQPPWLWTLEILPDGQIWAAGRNGALLNRAAP